jgi:hypothetical protein
MKIDNTYIEKVEKSQQPHDITMYLEGKRKESNQTNYPLLKSPDVIRDIIIENLEISESEKEEKDFYPRPNFKIHRPKDETKKSKSFRESPREEKLFLKGEWLSHLLNLPGNEIQHFQ